MKLLKKTNEYYSKWLEDLATKSKISWEVHMPYGEVLRLGNAPSPHFKIKVNSLKNLSSLNEMTIAEAYINEEIEIEGDFEKFLLLKQYINDNQSFLHKLKFIIELLRNKYKKIQDNKKIINQHYGYDDALFFSFLDAKYQCYSQGIFYPETETLEEAIENKLNQMWNALKLKPDMQLLDIGGGWGVVPKYCSSKGINITCLTVANNSYCYLQKLTQEKNLNCTILLEDFLAYKPSKQFDAIVIFGVIEHIPNYELFCQKIYECLKEDGVIYIDGSAAIEKYFSNGFAHKYIWPGAHSFLCLQNLIEELLYHGFKIKNVKEETVDYGLTMKHWALRLDKNQEFIVKKYGEKIYRAFKLYLWGGSVSMFTNDLQAYSLVAVKDKSPGVRPNIYKRFKYFLYSVLT